MSWWQYLILANIYLVLFYLFYAALLRQETFFQLNRIYLLASAILSFVIPVIQADWVKGLFITRQVQYTIYSSPVIIRSFAPAAADTGMSNGRLLAIAYFTGVFLFTCRLIWQTALLRRMLRQSKPADAYSFFRKVKIGAAHTGNQAIANHERTHALQLHSADIMLAEMLMIVNWFNPVVYFYRSAISHIHEFIADRSALNAGSGKREYAVMLLNRAMNVPAHQLVNPFFNNSSLKQRIIMLHKNRSNRIALAKYGFSAPLFVLMLILSSATVSSSKTVKMINLKLEEVVLLPPANAADKAADARYNADTTKKGMEIFTSAEHAPEFKGGLNAFYKFLGANIHYPAQMKKDKLQGKVVIQFIVEKDGSLSNFRIIRSLSPQADEESLRVLKLSPKWNPGIQNGKRVRVQYVVPISFALEDVKPTNRTGSLPVSWDNKYLASAESKADTTVIDAGQSTHPPLYIIDGVEAGDVTGLDPRNIESMSVLKGDHIPLKYRDKGKYGVIIITTKSIAPRTDKPGTSNLSGYIDNSRSTGAQSF